MFGFGFSASGFTVSIDPDFQFLLDRGTTLGYSLPTGTALTAGNQLVEDLKAAGIWSKLDVFYVFATNGDSDFATLNWKAPASFQATKVSSPTFTSLEGFTGNGTTSYLNTNLNPSTATNFQQNSNSAFAYLRTNTANSNYSDWGASSGSTLVRILKNRLIGPNGAAYNASDTEGTTASLANPNSGLHHINRSASNAKQWYVNGASYATSTQVSAARPNANLYVLATNTSGTAGAFSGDQMAIFGAGASLLSESAGLFTAIETYMDAIGKGVVA